MAKVQTPDGVTAAIDLSCKAFLDCDAMLERGFKSRVYDWKWQKSICAVTSQRQNPHSEMKLKESR
ncbi:MAG: hypothetical protein IKA01_10670 [Alistipes sp.]|nr:hypothetical protein [Alistipes sp.]